MMTEITEEQRIKKEIQQYIKEQEELEAYIQTLVVKQYEGKTRRSKRISSRNKNPNRTL